MQYRSEIDGLRALAVLPVILGHAKLGLFSGGFIGVDVFFVISGYLITNIIINDLDNGDFSIAKFYERRARRILPALFLVMLLTTPFAGMWMMPEDFKNYGQSLVATTLFSNNVLLALTSGYWASASDFKPLLHTWSLGVEEQYYILFPIIMIGIWKFVRWSAPHIMISLMLASFCLATWSITQYPEVAFYILPTRAWELLAGALTAYCLIYRPEFNRDPLLRQGLSLAGLVMIIFSVFVFDDSYLSPGPWILVPVVGSVLIVAFAVEGTLVQRLLSNSLLVGIGLISYSLYLWHQPLFAMARIYAIDMVSTQHYLVLCAVSFLLAYLTWRFVEAPFRDRKRFGMRSIAIFSLCAATCLVGFGLYLNRTYGMYWRVFDRDDSIADLDKRIYNERAFKYKVSQFSDDYRLNVLVIGNSFGRDVINMIWEGFGEKTFDLAYSDTGSTCIERNRDLYQQKLFHQADVIVFASDYTKTEDRPQNCIPADISWSEDRGKDIFYISTKHFGENLNWIVRLPRVLRADQYNNVPKETIDEHRRQATDVPSSHFVSLLAPVMKDRKIPITDSEGKPISTDRVHVTKYGAIYFAEHAIKPSPLGTVLAIHAK